ncbi:hypothetical protein WAI453_007097 [Rhynchosporium graminicola]
MAPIKKQAVSPASSCPEKHTGKELRVDKTSDSCGMSNLVTFTIGPEKKKFLIHKNFACEASPIFKSAFNSSFVEGQSQEYVLEDTTEAAFTMFTEWVYTGRLEINFTRYSAETVDRNGKCGLLQCNLMELWLLA